MKAFRLQLLLIAWAVLCSAGLHAEPTLLGHKNLSAQPLDGESVKAILLGKKVVIGETRVVIVIAKAGVAQEQMLKESVGMNTSQFQNYWRRLFMTGGGTAPKVVETEDEACKFAIDTPGAVVIAERAKAGDLAVLAAGR